MTDAVYTPHLGREVFLRPGTRDDQVWADTFTGLYHVPPMRMPAPSTVLDLGANIGLTAAHYRHLWPEAEIVAVELDEDNARMAEMNVARRVQVRHEAVAIVRAFLTYDSAAGEDAYRLDPDGDRRVRALPLRSIILRSFADIEERGGVDFVKMDVEGTEWSLFRQPDWAPLVRHLLVELHGGDDERPARLIGEAAGLLFAAGFQVQPHERHPQAVFAWR